MGMERRLGLVTVCSKLAGALLRLEMLPKGDDDEVVSKALAAVEEQRAGLKKTLESCERRLVTEVFGVTFGRTLLTFGPLLRDDGSGTSTVVVTDGWVEDIHSHRDAEGEPLSFTLELAGYCPGEASHGRKFQYSFNEDSDEMPLVGGELETELHTH